MSLNATVKARVDENVKLEVAQILHDIGLNTSQAINIFFKKVIAEKGIPFELKVPNEATTQAMEEAKNMDGEITSFEDLKNEKLNA
ncbi:MAG: type II toxin-antitoxin system RelB/DinJ family antitoxin [Campylobacterota bacterium]|nr:type II toxin-antitoxin system RelB/DinJ family antitoxin [Campylobacterota bacterium]